MTSSLSLSSCVHRFVVVSTSVCVSAVTSRKKRQAELRSVLNDSSKLAVGSVGCCIILGSSHRNRVGCQFNSTDIQVDLGGWLWVGDLNYSGHNTMSIFCWLDLGSSITGVS